MLRPVPFRRQAFMLLVSLLTGILSKAQESLPAQKSPGKTPAFRVIAFYTAKYDPAHISFVHEANRRFPEMAKKYHFSYRSATIQSYGRIPNIIWSI